MATNKQTNKHRNEVAELQKHASTRNNASPGDVVRGRACFSHIEHNGELSLSCARPAVDW